jgi:hypothetical protein
MLDDLRILFLSASAGAIYTSIGVVLALVFLLGVWAGTQTRAELCAEDIVALDQARTKAQELNTALTSCEANKSGKNALECSAICAKQVSKALDDAKAWECSE